MVHYLFEDIYKKLSLFQNNPYLIYFKDFDGYDVFKVSYALRKYSNSYYPHDLQSLLDDWETAGKGALEKYSKDTDKFVYFIRKTDSKDGYFFNPINYDGIYFYNIYNADYIAPKEIPNKFDKNVLKVLSKIDKRIKVNIINSLANCPDFIPDDSLVSEMLISEIKNCKNFKYIGDNVNSITQIKIDGCENFTHVGKNFNSNNSLLVMNCDNFSKIKRGIDLYALYVSNCKNFDFDSLSNYSKIDNFYVWGPGFSSDILSMYNGKNLDEIDNYLSSNFPNVNFKNISFEYQELYDFSEEERESIKNHFKSN